MKKKFAIDIICNGKSQLGRNNWPESVERGV
jgi:hypothetical protein